MFHTILGLSVLLSMLIMGYRNTPGKRTGCNANRNSPAADRTGVFTRGGTFTRAGLRNSINSVCDERGCNAFTGEVRTSKKQLFWSLDKCHRRHNEGRFVQVLAAASLRIQCKFK